MFLQGNIIAGEFDSSMNEFSLQKIKSFSTETILRESQLTDVFDYLKKHQHDEDGQILSLYDQLLIPLTQNEINQLIGDFERVKSMFH